MYIEEDSSCSSPEYINEEILKKRIKYISKPKVDFVLENTSNIEMWLDIGCGGGEILVYLRELGIKGYGIESDPKEIKFLEKHEINFMNAYIDFNKENIQVDNALKKADVISMINVLEHIVYSKNFIEYIIKQMKKGAYLVIEVPRHPSVASFMNLTNNNNVYRHVESPNHLQIFSDKSLKYILDDSCDIISI